NAGNVIDASGDGANVARGGGLYLDGVDPTVTSSSVADNEALAAGNDATAAAGGVYLTSSVEVASLTGCTLDGNAATATPTAGSESFASAEGGAIFSVSAEKLLTLTECSLSDNSAQAMIAGADDGAARGGAVWIYGSSGTLEHRLVLDRSTVANNTVQADGAAQGGGVYGVAATGDAIVTVVVRNSTLTGNAVVGDLGRGGAIYAATVSGDAVANVGLFSSTVTLNTATDSAGGLYLEQGTSTAVLNAGMANSILFGNMAPAAPECSVDDTDMGSLGFNMIGDDSGCTFVGATSDDMLGINPGLSPLAANGGATLTHAIDGTSPAFDAGAPDGCNDEDLVELTVDQRGEDRPASVACDVGAFELQP
ncbi:MAG: choice-of-anchor Q domain-containing protein, partial [Myxococcota bacterium]